MGAAVQLDALNTLVTAGLASGEVRPLPVTVFLRTDIEEAFRYLASGMDCMHICSLCYLETVLGLLSECADRC